MNSSWFSEAVEYNIFWVKGKETPSMEDSSNKALKGGNTENEQSAHCNNSAEVSAGPQSRERPQAFCEDSTFKTIEFLRARLLAERATSKAAKECTEQNAKRLMELERMLEIETKQRNNAEAAMQEMIDKLRIARPSSASDNVISDRTVTENQMLIEDKEESKDDCGSNSIYTAATEEEQDIRKADLDNNRLPKDGHLCANSVQTKLLERSREGSNDFMNKSAEDYGQNSGVSENQTKLLERSREGSNDFMDKSAEDYGQNSGLSENQTKLLGPSREGSNDFMDKSAEDYGQNSGLSENQMSDQTKIEGNVIVSSSLLLQNKDDYYASRDDGMSLKKDDQKEKGNGLQGPSCPESFAGRSVSMTPRVKFEEKVTELFSQIGDEVVLLAGQDKKEFLKLKLHELVDQIVSEKEVPTYENSTPQTFDHSSKLPLLVTTSAQTNTNDRNSESSYPQPEIPWKEPNIVDSLQAYKSFQSNSDVRNQNETTAPATERLRCKRHENIYGHGLHCCGLRHNILNCQDIDFSDPFLTGKGESQRHKVLQNTIPKSFSQRQTTEMQACLENNKEDELYNLQCRCLSEVHRLHQNHGKTMYVRSSYNQNQAEDSMELGNPLELWRVSGSDGCMAGHHDLKGSRGTGYIMKRQSPASRFYQRFDILPTKVGLSPQRNCHKYLPLQLPHSCKEMPNCNKNAGCTRLPSQHDSSAFLSSQCSSKFTALAEAEPQRLTTGKVKDALVALGHAKEQIQSSIRTRHNSGAYMGLSSSNGQNTCRQLVLR